MLPVLFLMYAMVLTIVLGAIGLVFIALDDYLKDREYDKMSFSKVYDQIQYDHKFNQAVKAANLASGHITDPYYWKKEWDKAFDLAMNS